MPKKLVRGLKNKSFRQIGNTKYDVSEKRGIREDLTEVFRILEGFDDVKNSIFRFA